MEVFIVGAGGQARIVYEILSYDRNIEVVGFTDNVIKKPNETIFGKPILGRHFIWKELIAQGIKAAIVAIVDNKIRTARFKELCEQGIEMIKAIHPQATISPSSLIGKGTVVCSNAVINTLARVGDNCIINTCAIIEHEDIIGNNVHIGPGVALAGRVTVQDNTFIGLRSVVKEYLTIGRNVIIGAGSVVLEDIPDNVMTAGIPAKIKKRIK